MSRVPTIKLLKEDNIRQGFFERHDYESVMCYLPVLVRPAVQFAYLTGWRLHSEILPLQWRQVDLAGGVVRLEPTMSKTGQGRTFPLTPELRSLLEAQRAYTDRTQQQKGCIIPWVFHRAGQRIKSLRRAWQRACRRAGCPGRIPHDMRRTAVRNMVRAGIPERVAMQLSGRKTRTVFDRYNIVSEGDLHEAVRKLSVQDPLQAAPESFKQKMRADSLTSYKNTDGPVAQMDRAEVS